METRIYTYGMLLPTQGGERLESQLRAGHSYFNALLEIEREKRARVEDFWAGQGAYADVLAELRAAETAAQKLRKSDPPAERKAAWARVDGLRRDVRERRAAAVKATIPPEDARRAERKKELVKAAKERGEKLSAEALTVVLDAEPDCVSPRRRAQIAFSVDAEKRGVKVSGKKLNAALRDAGLTRATQEIEDQAAAQTLIARRHYGVHWGTYLLIHAAVEQAISKADDFPRFKRWDGHGRIGVPISTGKGIDVAAVHDCGVREDGTWIEERGCRVLQILPVDATVYSAGKRVRRRGARTTVRVCVDTRDRGKFWVEFPMTLHRPLPPEAKIVGAWIKVSPRGPSSFSYELQLQLQDVTFAMPSSRGHGTGTIAINLGWRASGRVMFALRSDGQEREFCLPQEITHKLALADQARAKRDLAANKMRDQLIGWLAECGAPAAFEPTGEIVIRPHWSSDPEKARETQVQSIRERIERLRVARDASLPMRLRWIYESWTQEREAGRTREVGAVIYGHLREWVIEDKRDQRRESGLRRRAARRRDEIVILWAHEICNDADTVLLENTNYAVLKTRRNEAVPVEVDEKVGRLRDACAPGELRRSLEEICAKRGVTTARVDARDLTSTHHACGHKMAHRPQSIRATCDVCGAHFDQDHNFCVGLFERSGDGQTPGTARSGGSMRKDDAAE